MLAAAMWVQNIAKKHPILYAAVSFAIVALPEWLASVWSLYSNEPLSDVVSRKLGGINIPGWFGSTSSIILGLGMFGYLIYVLRKGQRVEFFPTYSQLGKAYARTECIFKEGNELHGYFLSGEGLLSWEGKKHIGRFSRIIVPNPSGPYLCILQTLHTDTNPYLRASDQIRATTKLAQSTKVPIKWFDDYIGVNILICNPMQNDGWIHISIAPPFLEAEWQPTIRLEKSQFPESFNRIYAAFGKLWDQSHLPHLSERNLSLEKEFISMKDAAELLYRESRKCKSSLAKQAEELSGYVGGQPARGSPEDILNWMATYISGKLSVYGKRLPATAFEKIESGEVRACSFIEGATQLVDQFFNKMVRYTDLAVKSSELQGLIDDVQFQSGYEGETQSR
jgi:hypothetical protein